MSSSSGNYSGSSGHMCTYKTYVLRTCLTVDNFGSKLFIFHCNSLTNFDTIVFYTTWTQTLKRGALLVDFTFKVHKRAVSTLIYVM